MTRPRHAFVVRDTYPLPPLGAPASESVFLGKRLFEQMRAHLERAGMVVELVDTIEAAAERAAAAPGGAVVTHDSVAFSAAVLARFLAAADRAPDAAALTAALPDAIAVRRLSYLDGMNAVTIDDAPAFTAPLHLVRRAAKLADARPILLPFKEHVARGPLPPGMLGVRELAIGFSDSYLCRVDHWLQIIRVNQAALAGHWIERGSTWRGRLWYLWRALCGFPWRRGRIAESIRRIHPRAKVHHTAHVELSVVEEGATIGVNAIVKGSWICRGAQIQDGAAVNGSVIGEGAFVANGSIIDYSLLYPDSFGAAHKMQLAMLGEGAVAFTGSYFYDTNLGGNVRVAHRGRVVDCGDRLAAVCMGPWSRVAGALWVAAGREIPAGAVIVQPPDEVLAGIDVDLATTRMTTIRDRKLVDAGPLPPATSGAARALAAKPEKDPG